jgi:hypothetical protein
MVRDNIMARKSATEVKIDFLVKEIRELRNETASLRADINKGKGAIWILLVISAIITSGYNYFK